jgi:L,D-transpeptidase YcbB
MLLDQDSRRITVTFSRFLAVAAMAWACTVAAQGADYREELRIAVERLRYTDDRSISASGIAAGALVAEFYERRSFLPAWQDRSKIESLVTLIDESFADGLNPRDYHQQAIEEQYARFRAGRDMTSAEWAAFELVLTDALISLVYHHRYGKADPLTQHASWNFRGTGDVPDVLGVIESAMNAPLLREFVLKQFVRGPFYRNLRTALAAYRQIASEGGWPMVAHGPALDYGTTDERIVTLAARLAKTRDIDDAAPYTVTATMDGTLQEGVRRFQRRHGLQTDGVVGPATTGALNVPVEQRIMQLRLTLERARWVLDGIGESFVAVNIAGFRVYVIASREMVWESRVVVGTANQQTPVFRDELQYIVFNPDWTVPYSIATREMLPEIKASQSWFATRDFEVRDRTGSRVDASSIDWSAVTPRTFDYLFVQRPGPNNALGQVKFVFPNEHAVYLHDTPAKEFFRSAERTFSHGCIRVENPLELAEILLRPNGWDRKRIDAAVASKRTTTVFLAKPLPILLLYWTANVDPDGTVFFYRDVYQRDPPVAKALDESFRIESVALPGSAP